MKKVLVTATVALSLIVMFQAWKLHRYSQYVEFQDRVIQDYWDLLIKCNKE